LTLPNLGERFDRLVALMLQTGYDAVLTRFKAELARGRLSTLKQWAGLGWGRGALMAWNTHARWLAIGSVPGRDVMEALGEQAQAFAGTVETRALAVFGRGQSPLEPAAYLNMLAGIAVRAGYHGGAEAAAAAGEAKFKMWIRSYSGPSEHRHWHDALNGATVPRDAKFVLSAGPDPGAEVNGPHDWASLPSAAQWVNCGHALIYVPAATREDVLKGVRFSSLAPRASPTRSP
jgi:hypothetical protein